MYWKSKTWLQQPLSLPSGALQRSGGSQSQLDVTDSLQPRWTQAAFMQLRFIPSQHSLCCANPTLFHPHDQLSPSYCPSSAPFPFPLPSWCPTHPSYKVSEGYTGRGEAEAWGAVILQGRIVIANKKKTNIGEQRVKNAVPSKHGSEDEAPSYPEISACSSLSAASLLATLAVTGTHLCMAMSTEKRFVLCIWYLRIVTRNKRWSNCSLKQVIFFKWHMKNMKKLSHTSA